MRFICVFYSKEYNCYVIITGKECYGKIDANDELIETVGDENARFCN